MPRNQTTRLCGPPGLRGGHRLDFPVVQERGWLRAGLPAESKAGKLSGSPREDGAAGAEAALTETGEGPRVESRWGHSGSMRGAGPRRTLSCVRRCAWRTTRETSAGLQAGQGWHSGTTLSQEDRQGSPGARCTLEPWSQRPGSGGSDPRKDGASMTSPEGHRENQVLGASGRGRRGGSGREGEGFQGEVNTQDGRRNCLPITVFCPILLNIVQ